MEQIQATKQRQSPERVDSKPAKTFSCLRCFERKVKCDKNHPCSNCVRSNVDCHFRTPSAPRRKKKKGTEEILLDRLRQAEELLRSKGILLDSAEVVSSRPVPAASPHRALNATNQLNLPVAFRPIGMKSLSPEMTSADSRLIIKNQSLFNPGKPIGKLIVDQSGSKSRFIENNLWSSVSSEFPDPKDAIADESSEDDEGDTVAGDDHTEFLLGLTPSSSNLVHLHPDQEGIFKLWAVFLENVNPMTKMIHYPTLQEKLVLASQDVEKVERELETLMFAIYLCAITSLDDSECEKSFKETRHILLARYRQGTKRSLSRSRFLGTGDIQVLQAFVLYLLMMRDEYDSRTLWTLTGVANRIAQSMGIHRDGTTLGLPPFETEMRRRLWWQIITLDFRSAELTGSGRFGDINLSDTRVPTNTNDPDIWPGMTKPPVNQTLPTEMLACLIRCEFGAFWKEKTLQRSLNGELSIINKHFLADTKDSPHAGGWGFHLSPEEREKNISELEGRLQEKFLKYCDHAEPLQLMAILIARGAVGAMRLMAHHPRRSAAEVDIPERTQELLWDTAVRLIQNDNISHATRALRKFRWHINVYFQWQAMIYILRELRTRTRGPRVDEAWKQVDECWENHPQFVTEYRKPLHVAVGNLCLKAYEARERSLKEDYEEKKAQGVFVLPHTTPAYIEMLRQQRDIPRRKDSKVNSPTSFAAPTSTGNTTGIATDNSAMPASTFAQPSLPQQSMSFPQVHVPMSGTGSGVFPRTGFSDDPVAMSPNPNVGISETFDEHAQMDWNQWDYLIQEWETPNIGGGRWGL